MARRRYADSQRPTVCFNAFSALSGNLASLGQQPLPAGARQQLFNLAIFVPLCIGLNIVLVQTMGVEGVVVATSAAWLVVHVPAYWLYLHQWNGSIKKPAVSDEDRV